MRERTRRSAVIATTMALMAAMACASNPRPGTYTRLIITGSEIREAGYRSAYEALTHHRELIIFEDRIGFRGGNDNPWTRDGSGRVQPRPRMSQSYHIPLLVVDGDFNQNDAVTTLRRIPAEEIVSIRLYHQSMVPARYRRPGAEGGVIEVNTR
ncbi:hypothetical protein [Candidatus Palauibacter polyketidifaciens]|uniref:hypothetical protein n=1 Tax=Candidatus Palauibacter polyketidifaciens TaxID=3056740 RepID=UPI00139C8EFD|nr:hypothetical protein [Candidatus Palauibacter polyketidifaciens]MDE2721127.1 hypothetical protein [Candidatus Palauibacter polyketidifaciens]MYE34389.1 hypothetical protein [Gemmatimonadales bacterium]